MKIFRRPFGLAKTTYLQLLTGQDPCMVCSRRQAGPGRCSSLTCMPNSEEAEILFAVCKAVDPWNRCKYRTPLSSYLSRFSFRFCIIFHLFVIKKNGSLLLYRNSMAYSTWISRMLGLGPRYTQHFYIYIPNPMC